MQSRSLRKEIVEMLVAYMTQTVMELFGSAAHIAAREKWNLILLLKLFLIKAMSFQRHFQFLLLQNMRKLDIRYIIATFQRRY